MKKIIAKPEMIEGQEASDRFDAALKQILSVSKDELNKRLAAEKEFNAGKPKRGPKPRQSSPSVRGK